MSEDILPQFSKGRVLEADGSISYNGKIRWRWWYDAIADWMIRNPGGKLSECAKELNKSYTTISMIINTDLFQDYLAKRKTEFQRDHDHAIRSRLTAVAEATLDHMLETIKKQGDQIPLKVLESLSTSALDRLGYAPSSTPSVVVNNNVDNSTKTVHLPGLSHSELTAARDLLRAAESAKAGSSLLPASSPSTSVGTQSDGSVPARTAAEEPGAEPSLRVGPEEALDGEIIP